MLRGRLLGSSLLKACSRLAGRPIEARRAIARAKFIDSQASPDEDRIVDWLIEEAVDRGLPCDTLAARRLLRIAGKARRPYLPNRRDDLDVVIAYFNPVGYTRNSRHIHKTCEDLLAAGIRPIVAEIIHHDEVPLPKGVVRLQFRSTAVLFHKENLQNLAASLCSRPKILFADCDLEFSRRDVFRAISEALDRFDVVQPFSEANWLDERGAISATKRSMAEAIATAASPNINLFHPGFAWAMTRNAFDALGGFYERHPCGGGDSAFAYALSGEPMEHHIKSSAPVARTGSHMEYATKAAGAGLRVGVVEGRVFHLWHGSKENRRYVSRYDYLPATVDGEYPMHRRPDGLLEWDDQSHSSRMLQYFIDRREDG